MKGKPKGSVFRRKQRDGTLHPKWSIKYDTYAKGQRKAIMLSNKFDSEEEAWAALTAIQLDIKDGQHIIPNNATVAQAVETWLERLDVRPSTAATYRRSTRHIVKHLGRMKVREVKASHIETMLSKLAKPGSRLDKKPGPLSASARRHAYAMAKLIFQAALVDGEIKRNPALSVKRPKIERGEYEVWTEAEAREFLGFVRTHPLYALFILALNLGMRRGELLGLRWRDIDFENEKIRISQNRITIGYQVQISKPKTDSGTREIEADEITMRVLSAHSVRQAEERLAKGVGKANGDDPIFAKLDDPRDFLHPDAFDKTYRKLRKAPGVKRIRFHDLRHTCASIALRNGADILAVSKMLGHSSPGFTLSIYGHMLPGQIRNAATKTATAIQGLFLTQ